jgi:hypothetical protein
MVENAFVDATPISGPACICKSPVDSRASADPTTLVIARVGQPFDRAALTAPIVSAVSPDWDTATTKVCGPTIASR